MFFFQLFSVSCIITGEINVVTSLSTVWRYQFLCFWVWQASYDQRDRTQWQCIFTRLTRHFENKK